MSDLAERLAVAAYIAYLRRKADFHFERSKAHYRRWRLKTKFDPNQPRIPAGQAGGGRWTDGGGSGDLSELARSVESVDERVLAQHPSDARVHLAGVIPPEARGMSVQTFVSLYCLGSIRRELPGQFLGSPISQVMIAAMRGDVAARRCMKLLNEGRFRKR